MEILQSCANFDGLVQDFSISSALAMEILQSCANFDGLVQEFSISSMLAMEILQSYTKSSLINIILMTLFKTMVVPLLMQWSYYHLALSHWSFRLKFENDSIIFFWRPFICFSIKTIFAGVKILIIPPLQRSWKRGILVSPCLSVCPSLGRIVSALYLQQYLSDPFHICTAEGVSRVKFVSKFKNW